MEMIKGRRDRKEALVKENTRKNNRGHKIDKVNANENNIIPKLTCNIAR